MPDENPESTSISTRYHKTLKDYASILLRRKVSQNRWRFEEDGFNMDLAYITDRIIAMGYPAEGKESIYRNSMHNTVKFLLKRHGKGHVKIFNLRGGHMYKMEHFESDIICFNMEDHHPPSLELMAPFCREAKEFLDADPENVIAVHCKAGKGRTGVMICALLIYINYYPSPRQILDYYSIVRTQNNKGVTIPSQRRYVYYFDKLRRMKLNYFPTRVQLVGLNVECPPKTHRNRSCFRLTVWNGKSHVWDSNVIDVKGRPFIEEMNEWKSGKARMDRSTDYKLMPSEPTFLEGDVQVQIVRCGDVVGKKKHVIGHVWFNTMFACIDGKVFDEGDNAYPYEDGQTSICKKNLLDSQVYELPANSKYAGRSLGAEGLKIEKPSGYEAHNGNAEQLIYRAKNINPPNTTISNRLHRAHVKGLVKDDYNIRLNKPTSTEFVKSGIKYTNQPEHRSKAQVIPHNDGEHVLEFPIFEVDDMVKNKAYDDSRFRLFVVVKCIDPNDSAMMKAAELACRSREHAQSEKEYQPFCTSENYQKFPPAPVVATCMGAEQLKVPNVRYADQNGGYQGHAHPNLSPHEFQFNVKSRTAHYYRYFFRQRRDSVSKYPGQNEEHWCPLIRRDDGPPSDRRPPGSGPSSSSERKSSKDAQGSSSSFSKKAPGSSRPAESSSSEFAPGASTSSAPHDQEQSSANPDEIDHPNSSPEDSKDLARLKDYVTRLLSDEHKSENSSLLDELDGFAIELGAQFDDYTRPGPLLAASVLYRIGEALRDGTGFDDIARMIEDLQNGVQPRQFSDSATTAGLGAEASSINDVVDGPVSSDDEVPAEIVAEAPVDAPLDAPAGVQDEAPAEVPAEVVAEAPAEVEAPAADQTDAPAEVPAEIVAEAPAAVQTDAPAEVPAEVVAEAPAEVAAEVPSEPTPDAPVIESIEEVPAEPTAAAPTDAPVDPTTDIPADPSTSTAAEGELEIPPEAPTNASADLSEAAMSVAEAAMSVAEAVAADAVAHALSADLPLADVSAIAANSPEHVKKLTTKFEEISQPVVVEPVVYESPKKRMSKKVSDVVANYSKDAKSDQPLMKRDSQDSTDSNDSDEKPNAKSDEEGPSKSSKDPDDTHL